MVQRQIITLHTALREELVDITSAIEAIAQKMTIKNGVLSVYAQGATAAIMIQENWDQSIPPTWQGIFFCEFDGPRSERTIVCTALGN